MEGQYPYLSFSVVLILRMIDNNYIRLPLAEGNEAIQGIKGDIVIPINLLQNILN